MYRPYGAATLVPKGWKVDILGRSSKKRTSLEGVVGALVREGLPGQEFMPDVQNKGLRVSF